MILYHDIYKAILADDLLREHDNFFLTLTLGMAIMMVTTLGKDIAMVATGFQGR